MARYNPGYDLPNANQVIVHSDTYGPHLRAKRGSKKKAELNDALQWHTELMPGANTPARLVKNEIDRHRDGLPSGQLWQQLVGMFKRQLKLQLPLNVDELMLADISRKYPLAALLKKGYRSDFSFEGSYLSIEIQSLYPYFRRATIDGYQVVLSVMYFNFRQMKSRSSSAASEIVPLDHPGILSFQLEKGKKGERFMICLKVIGCCKDDSNTGNPSMGMRVIKTGIIT